VPDPGQLPAKQRAVLDAQPVAEHDTSPATPPSVPPARARVAVVTSAGLNLRSQEPFRREDPGFRVLPSSTPPSEIVQSHSSIGFDRTAMARDPDVVYPVGRLRELVDRGVVGEVAPRCLSFMGAQFDPAATLAGSAERAAAILVEDGVDIVVLTPT
jgi:D-proline reductase (dithiol) PrdB